MSGDGLAARCGHAFDEQLVVHEDGDPDWWFCKLDRLERFLAEHAPRRRFVLVTHNSDYPVGARYKRVLRSWRIRAWLAANVDVRHRKLIPLPLGVANAQWEHGDQAAIRAAQTAAVRKTALVDVSFSLDTNPAERRRCLEQSGLEQAPRAPYTEYLARLGASYFCLSPRGYGIDTHRTWEALYLRTVPIVARSALTDEYPDLPWIVVDDWSELRSLDLSPELYTRVMGDWQPSSLGLDALVTRLRRRLASRRLTPWATPRRGTTPGSHGGER